MSSDADRWSLPDATVGDVTRIRAFVHDACARLGAAEDVTFRLSLAAEEVCTNAIVHGYDGGPGLLELCVRAEGDAVSLTVRDQARSFDPISVPKPAVDGPLEQRGPGGWGLHLVSQLVDRVDYRDRGEGNELVITINDRRGP